MATPLTPETSSSITTQPSGPRRAAGTRRSSAFQLKLAQAAAAAVAWVSRAFDAEPIACEVMTDAQFEARQGWEQAPGEVVSVAEAALMLG